MYHKVASTGWVTGCMYGSEDFRTIQTTNLYLLTLVQDFGYVVGRGAFIAGVRVHYFIHVRVHQGLYCTCAWKWG